MCHLTLKIRRMMRAIALIVSLGVAGSFSVPVALSRARPATLGEPPRGARPAGRRARVVVASGDSETAIAATAVVLGVAGALVGAQAMINEGRAAMTDGQIGTAVYADTAGRSATCTPAQAEKVVELAKKTISANQRVRKELGAPRRINQILGFGSPSPGVVAVSFSASFGKEGGFFETTSGEKQRQNRGEVVCKVSAKTEDGKLVTCTILKDGGWGKGINVI